MGGLALAATLPSGDSRRDLGMGHVMLMPGSWLTWHNQIASLALRVGYGRALVGGGAAHHHGGGAAGPIVNPMNMSEVESSLSAGLRLAEQLRLGGGLYGAVPVVATDGTSRAAAFAGVNLTLAERFDLGIEGHLPLAGAPFLAKLVLSAGARF